jgi:hypothetical protein
MRSSRVRIDSPCHESWEAMEGGAERRYCGVCEKHVHDLSAMNMADAEALLQASTGQHLCVRYTAEADGTLRFRDLVPRSRLTRKLLRTAFAAATLAACDAREVPAVDLGDAVIESMRASTVPTADGGCDYTTGPFTTFHLPPGHTLCAGGGAAAIAASAPAGPPRTDEAIAATPVDSFVPCDPKPVVAPPPDPRFATPPDHRFAPPPDHRFAPPPPRFAPPPDPPHVRMMGDIAAPPPDEPLTPVQGGISVEEPPPTEPRFAPPPAPRFAPPPAPEMGSVAPVRDDSTMMGRRMPVR